MTLFKISANFARLCILTNLPEEEDNFGLIILYLIKSLFSTFETAINCKVCNNHSLFTKYFDSFSFIQSSIDEDSKEQTGTEFLSRKTENVPSTFGENMYNSISTNNEQLSVVVFGLIQHHLI